MRATLLILSLLLAGCSSSGVMRVGPNHYYIVRASAAGMFANPAALEKKVIREANEWAAKQGKQAVSIDAEFTHPQNGVPRFRYVFELADPPKEKAGQE